MDVWHGAAQLPKRGQICYKKGDAFHTIPVVAKPVPIRACNRFGQARC